MRRTVGQPIQAAAGFFEVRTVVDGVKSRLERRLQAGLPAPELMQNERH